MSIVVQIGDFTLEFSLDFTLDFNLDFTLREALRCSLRRCHRYLRKARSISRTINFKPEKL